MQKNLYRISGKVAISQVVDNNNKYKTTLNNTKLITHKWTSISLKPGFHYPSWRPELTGDRFPLPVNTGCVDGCTFSLAELTGRQHGPSTRLVETGLNLTGMDKADEPGHFKIPRNWNIIMCYSCTKVYISISPNTNRIVTTRQMLLVNVQMIGANVI